MTKQEYLFWLSNIEEIGRKRYDALLCEFGSVEYIYSASESELCHVKGIGEEISKKIVRSKENETWRYQWEQMKKEKIHFVFMTDEDYPKALLQLYDTPISLFYKGKIPSEGEQMLAMVGARNCSFTGKDIAQKYAEVFALQQISIVSGLAKGIDGYSHQGALNGGGRTYAVLGCGVDICYPNENYELYKKIIETGGIISEYPPGTKPLPGRFPRRNRIIAAFCQAIILIEARQKSGSLITCQCALDLGKEIFALPGQIDKPLASGGNRLIQEGAALVMSPSDVLHFYGKTSVSNNIIGKKKNIFLETDEKMVYAKLRCEPRYIEEIQKDVNISMEQLMPILFSMEQKGVCYQMIQNFYVRI